MPDVFPLVSRALQKLKASAKDDNNLLVKSLYTSWYSPFTPITPARNMTGELVSGYMDNETVYAIINKIADTCSSVPIKVVNAEGDEINHWATDVLKQPNPDTTLKELITNYYIYLLSIGNSFIYSPKLGDGRTSELWTMPSDLVNVVSGAFYEPISGYKFTEGNQETTFPKETVMHGKFFNPRFQSGSWVYGLSPVSVAAEMISAMNSATEATQSSFMNMGPPYIISSQTPEGLTPEQQEMLEATYKKKYGGPDKAGTPMLTGTPVKVEQVGVSPVDLNIIASSQHGLRVLCNVYGVSSILFNDNDNSTYNNVSQARKDFYQYTVQPLNQAFAERLKLFLVPDEDVHFKFDYSAVEVLQEAILTKGDFLFKADYLTPNEKRESLGYEPMDDPEMDEIKSQPDIMPLEEDDQEQQEFLNSLKSDGNKTRNMVI